MNAGANPFDPQSWNAYSYVMNNPLSNVDPTGLDVDRLGNCYWNVYVNPEDGSRNYGSIVCLASEDGSQQAQPPPPPKQNETPIAILPFPTQRSCSNIADEINDVRNELARRFQEYGDSAQPLPFLENSRELDTSNR